MTLLQRARQWLVQELSRAMDDAPTPDDDVPVLSDPREAVPVRIYTLNSTTIEGLLLSRGALYTLAPGALVMPEGARRWHHQQDHTYIPAAQVEWYTRIATPTVADMRRYQAR